MNKSVYPKFLSESPSIYGFELKEIIIAFSIGMIAQFFNIDDGYIFPIILVALALQFINRKFLQKRFFINLVIKKETIDRSDLC